MESTDKRGLSPEEAAAYTGYTRTGIYSLIRTGELPSLRIGRRRVVLRDDLDRLLESRRVIGTPAAG